MTKQKIFDVIIVGGSYSGLAAGMALGRALRSVLIIDSGDPCNKQTPHSHNFITQDGVPPGEISKLARQQVEDYQTVAFFDGLVIGGEKTAEGFRVTVNSGEEFHAKKLVFATGIKDIMPDIDGFAACWGISVLHCPYCHGYEVRNKKTGVLGNGEYAFDFSRLISNWTKDLVLYTNGSSTLTDEQTAKIGQHQIKVVEKVIEKFKHDHGQIQEIIFKDGSIAPVDALYAHCPFVQHCDVPGDLGCEITPEGYIKTDMFQKTSVEGVYACGDNSGRMRSVASAVAMGSMAGAAVNKEIIFEEF